MNTDLQISIEDIRADILAHQADLRLVFAKSACRALNELDLIPLDQVNLRREKMKEYFSLHEWIDKEDKRVAVCLEYFEIG